MAEGEWYVFAVRGFFLRHDWETIWKGYLRRVGYSAVTVLCHEGIHRSEAAAQRCAEREARRRNKRLRTEPDGCTVSS